MAEEENGRNREALAEILKLPSWTRKQAARVVEAQTALTPSAPARSRFRCRDLAST